MAIYSQLQIVKKKKKKKIVEMATYSQMALSNRRLNGHI